MARLIPGVIVAAIVLYLFGFVYWGMGPYGTLIWKHAADDEAAGAALVAHFPENGTYFVPGADQDQETVKGRFEKGPVAFVHMLAVEGRPQVDASIMIGGFVLNLLAIVLIAALLKIAAPALPTYAARVGFVALAGATAALFIEGNEAVWWQITWQWKLYQAVYDVAFWIIAGMILAAFIGPERTASAPQTVPS
jgi:hypothetical protein